MATDARIGLLLLVALAINIGWNLAPLGLAALVVASFAFYALLRRRLAAPVAGAALAVVWISYFALLLASGVTLGVGDRRLTAFGGGSEVEGLRMAWGAVLPLASAALLAAWGRGWPRVLAAAALAVGVLLGGIAVLAGSSIGDEVEDPDAPADDVGGVVEVLFVLPFVVAYGLVLGAAGALWRGAGRLTPETVS